MFKIVYNKMNQDQNRDIRVNKYKEFDSNRSCTF